VSIDSSYCGRLAPSPTGDLHLGHASTFLTAWQRARQARGRLILRIEDLDPLRCKPEYIQRIIEDLRRIGIDWDGEPIFQSHRRAHYLAAWRKLRDAGTIYPCHHSRREIAELAPSAPHGDEPIFPVELRADTALALGYESPTGINWRFKVPDGEVITFQDGRLGEVSRCAGKDFGDFLVWNRDDIPAYELAVVVDDAEMGVTEIVRGEDLLTSTARQILLHRALGTPMPATWHCPLLRDEHGRRLAKRDAARSLRNLSSSS